MPVLQVFVAGADGDRQGLPVAQWFAERAREHAGFEVQLVDLAEVVLRGASADADAFVFVMPDDNDGINAALKNVIDYLYSGWQYKPLGFVSYGNTSGGLRAVQTFKQVATTLKMTPIDDSVSIDDVGRYVEAGRFAATEAMKSSAKAMLDELWCLTPFLDALRGWAATSQDQPKQ